MAAIENEPVRLATPLIPEAQPAPHQWQNMPFWKKVRPWASSLTQMGVAACVSLAVIVGVQHYNGQTDATQQPETPVFNTLPMMGKASPVSLGVPADASAPAGTGQQQQVQEQRRRINAMLQDYELQRRLHSEQLQFEQAQTLASGCSGARLSNVRNATAVMKQLWCAMSFVAASLFFSANASGDVSSGALLQQMNLASQSLKL
jgi:anti sigma-E protein, RseA